MFNFFPVKEKGVKLIPLSDLHTGGSTALFPYFNGEDLGFPPHKKMTGEAGGWKFKHGVYTPNAKQYAMFRHFTKCAEQIATERNGRRFVVVEHGDATDGKHHNTLQLATHNIGEQNAVHVWLMQYFLHKIGFDKNKGDLLYIGQGTEAHDGDEEDAISEALGAETLPNGDSVFDFLPLEINGRLVWIQHQGAPAGRGITEGNALHNYMRNIYFTCLEDKRRLPDVIISGHYHRNVYDTFTRKEHTIHGIIVPPWQLKTRFGYRVAAAELDNIGLRVVDISSPVNGKGAIDVNEPILLQSRDEVVRI